MHVLHECDGEGKQNEQAMIQAGLCFLPLQFALNFSICDITACMTQAS
jgi:hypothetical protein